MRVGTKVKVLALPSGVAERLEPDEAPHVRSMVGEVFEVDDIDEHGFAWVTKWWKTGPDSHDAQSLALSAQEMEIAEPL